MTKLLQEKDNNELTRVESSIQLKVEPKIKKSVKDQRIDRMRSGRAQSLKAQSLKRVKGRKLAGMIMALTHFLVRIGLIMEIQLTTCMFYPQEIKISNGYQFSVIKLLIRGKTLSYMVLL